MLQTRSSYYWWLILIGMPVLIGFAQFAFIGATPATEETQTAESTKIAPPEYDKDGNLLQPTGYEKWVVVGTSVGLDYSDNERRDPSNPGMIHNVYVQPEAFDHYVQTGEFPEQTMFIVTNHRSLPAKTKGEISRTGFVAAPTSGLEISIKDSEKYTDGWAYFMFHDSPDTAAKPDRPVAKAFASKDCFECHAEHGAVDSVFTQYYSVLTEAREKHLAKAAAR